VHVEQPEAVVLLVVLLACHGLDENVHEVFTVLEDAHVEHVPACAVLHGVQPVPEVLVLEQVLEAALGEVASPADEIEQLVLRVHFGHVARGGHLGLDVFELVVDLVAEDFVLVFGVEVDTVPVEELDQRGLAVDEELEVVGDLLVAEVEAGVLHVLLALLVADAAFDEQAVDQGFALELVGRFPVSFGLVSVEAGDAVHRSEERDGSYSLVGLLLVFYVFEFFVDQQLQLGRLDDFLLGLHA